MKTILEPWKNLRNADEYLQKHEVRWKTVGLSVLVLLTYSVLLAFLDPTIAGMAGLMLSGGLVPVFVLTGFTMLIKSIQKADINVRMGNYFKYAFVINVGVSAVFVTIMAIRSLLGNIPLITAFGFLTMLVLWAYVPYRVFNLTKKQAILIVLLMPLQGFSILYLGYWWIWRGRWNIPRVTKQQSESKAAKEKKALKRDQD